MQNLISNLKIQKQKRSLNFIGSAWKWIAGNPDHDDYIIMSDKIEDIVLNNNNQVVINKAHNDRINTLTNVTNEIINMIRKDKSFEIELVLGLQYKLKLVKEEIINTIYAIELAKSNTISSNILSKTEVKLLLDNIDKDNIPYSNVEDALKFADVKIAQNQTRLAYIVNIPKTEPIIFQRIMLKPIKQPNNIINKIEYDNILKSNEIIYGVTQNCKKLDKLSICKRNNVIDLSQNHCIPNLLKSEQAICNVTNSHHIPPIEEIDVGIILLNNFEGPIEFDNTSRDLQGTFFIKFKNTTVIINNQRHTAEEIANIHALPPLLQAALGTTQLEEILSLELMKEIHINNTKQIRLMKKEKEIHTYVNYALTTIVFTMIMVTTILQKIRNSPKTSIAILPAQIPDQANLQEKYTPRTQEHHKSIYNIPYF